MCEATLKLQEYTEYQNFKDINTMLLLNWIKDNNNYILH